MRKTAWLKYNLTQFEQASGETKMAVEKIYKVLRICFISLVLIHAEWEGRQQTKETLSPVKTRKDPGKSF